MNFEEAYSAVLDYSNRPDLTTAAKREVNAACLRVNRRYPFEYSKELISVTFLGSGAALDVHAVGVKIQGVLAALRQGQIPLRVMTESALQGRLLNFEQDGPSREFIDSVSTPSVSAYSMAQIVGVTEGQIVVVSGQTVRLFPKQTADVQVDLLVHKQLEPLTADDDTNFLLTYAWDFIVLSALKRFNLYLKEGEQFSISSVQLQQEWSDLMEWDASIGSSAVL